MKKKTAEKTKKLTSKKYSFRLRKGSETETFEKNFANSKEKTITDFIKKRLLSNKKNNNSVQILSDKPDYTYEKIEQLVWEINKIGRNINQAVKGINMAKGGYIFEKNVESIEKAMKEIKDMTTAIRESVTLKK